MHLVSSTLLRMSGVTAGGVLMLRPALAGRTQS